MLGPITLPKKSQSILVDTQALLRAQPDEEGKRAGQIFHILSPARLTNKLARRTLRYSVWQRVDGPTKKTIGISSRPTPKVRSCVRLLFDECQPAADSG